jgi:predicted amidohydrolase
MTLERDRQAVDVVREVNDRVAHVGWVDAETDILDFLCECGAKDCVAVVKLTPNEYAQLRHRGPILMDGHARAKVSLY